MLLQAIQYIVETQIRCTNIYLCVADTMKFLLLLLHCLHVKLIITHFLFVLHIAQRDANRRKKFQQRVQEQYANGCIMGKTY